MRGSARSAFYVFRGLNFTVRSRVSLGSGTKAFARLRHVAQRWQPCVATLKESSCSKAAELLETRIKISGDAFFEKAFADGDKRDSNLDTIDEDEEKSGHK